MGPVATRCAAPGVPQPHNAAPPHYNRNRWNTMKALFSEKKEINEASFTDCVSDDEFQCLMGDFKVLESHIVYFSAGDSKIKEILVKKDPSYSV
jgi:hypothetical protein